MIKCRIEMECDEGALLNPERVAGTGNEFQLYDVPSKYIWKERGVVMTLDADANNECLRMRVLSGYEMPQMT